MPTQTRPQLDKLIGQEDQVRIFNALLEQSTTPVTVDICVKQLIDDQSVAKLIELLGEELGVRTAERNWRNARSLYRIAPQVVRPSNRIITGRQSQVWYMVATAVMDSPGIEPLRHPPKKGMLCAISHKASTKNAEHIYSIIIGIATIE